MTMLLMMARVMTSLMFVRPGDLYGRAIDFDIPTIALALLSAGDGAGAVDRAEIGRASCRERV